MYVDEYADSHVEVTYISAHTNHELGASELPHLPLPESVKEEVATKVSRGIPPEIIQRGNDPLTIIISTCLACLSTQISERMLATERNVKILTKLSLEGIF